MRVRIVTPTIEGDRIVPRLAQELCRLTGWEVADRPDSRADINYFFPYLVEEAVPGGSYTAAWFTHREEADKLAKKTRAWEEAARRVNLRVTSARMYVPELSRYGEVRHVYTPLDTAKFRPRVQAARSQGRAPVVGTSGWVYPGGRKGEHLLSMLVGSKLGQALSLRASGQGWPVPTTYWPWERQQEFFQGLDIYLSTSLVEGIGYGPLEALACGVRVVVPTGVGVFDELPEGPGVRHYPRGDYAGLERALEKALADQPELEALRALVEPWTVAAWSEGHRAAFTSLLSPPTPAVLPHWRSRAGVYIVAYGDAARRCAILATTSFKAHTPGIPVAIVSDSPLGPEDVFIQHEEVDIGARHQKITIFDAAPAEWEYVLYLDADTESVAPLSFLFDALADGWEMTICKNPGKFATADQMVREDNKDECRGTYQLYADTSQLMQWNGGVFGFRRSPRTAQFFRVWREEWERYGKRDQAALLRALWRVPLKTLWLGNEWNTVPEYAERDGTKTAGILHHPRAARRWSGIVWERGDSPEAWAKVQRHIRKEAKQ